MEYSRIGIWNCKGGCYGNKILYKNLDLTQDFPSKISFHFLWVKMLPKNLPKIFRWPEMCPLGKILAQDFQMAAFPKILGRQDKSVVPLLSTENCITKTNTACCMAMNAMQRYPKLLLLRLMYRARVRRLVLVTKGWACCVLICHQQKRTFGGWRTSSGDFASSLLGKL